MSLRVGSPKPMDETSDGDDGFGLVLSIPHSDPERKDTSLFPFKKPLGF